MVDKHRAELEEQFEEIAFSLLMDEYAEAEGEKLLQEFIAAKERGEVPKVPSELDKKCLGIIRKAERKQTREAWIRKTVVISKRVAVITLVLLCAASVVVASVDALRVPAFNFIIDIGNRFSSINFGDSTNLPEQDLSPEQLLEQAIPVGYQLMMRNEDEQAGTIAILYQNEDGHIITLRVSEAQGVLNYDTENAESVEIIHLGKHEAIHIVKGGNYILWIDANAERVYNFFASNIPQKEFIELAHLLATN